MQRQEAFEHGLATGQFRRATNKAGNEIICNSPCHVLLLEGVFTFVTPVLGKCRCTTASSLLLLQAYFRKCVYFCIKLTFAILHWHRIINQAGENHTRRHSQRRPKTLLSMRHQRRKKPSPMPEEILKPSK